MNWYYVGAGAICLFMGWQFSQADMISTSISCDGAALLSGSFIGLNQSYSQHLFTDDPIVYTVQRVKRGGIGKKAIPHFEAWLPSVM